MAKKTGKSKAQKRPAAKAGLRAGARSAKAGARASARSRAGARKTVRARRTRARKTAGAKAPKGKAARKKTITAAPPGKINTIKTKKAATRRVPGLERTRRQLREVEEGIPTPPSSLDMDRTASAARSGRRELLEAQLEHNETSPVMTGGDVDADWEDAYAVGDEAPGGDNPTPDQDRVDDIGKALGVEYQDNEELKGADKIIERDRKRWELDPASAEDYRDHDKDLDD